MYGDEDATVSVSNTTLADAGLRSGELGAVGTSYLNTVVFQSAS